MALVVVVPVLVVVPPLAMTLLSVAVVESGADGHYYCSQTSPSSAGSVGLSISFSNASW